MDEGKPVRLTEHAREQCLERGAEAAEVVETIQTGTVEAAKHGRLIYRANFPHDRQWKGEHYAVKQVAAVVAEEDDERVVITVYTFYF